MNKEICIAVCSVIAVFEAHASATIGMSNIASQMAIYYDTYGNTTANIPVYAEIMSNIGDGASWEPVVSASTGTSIMTVNESGYFDGGVGTVPWGTDGASVSFYVRAWSGTPTYNSSIELGKNGVSSIWQQNTGFWDKNSGVEPTGPTLEMSSHVLVQVQPMPEPSTISLLVLATPFLIGSLKNKKRTDK